MELVVIILIAVGAIILILLTLFLISKSKGKILIELEKYSFAPGETINGKVTLKLKKMVHAKSMEMGLIGISDSTNYNVGRGKGVSRSNSSERIFDFSYPIAGEGEYNPGTPPSNFQIKIPQNILTRVSTGNQVVDNVIKTAMFVTGNNRKIKWYVTGRLKIGGFDLRKKVQINIA